MLSAAHILAMDAKNLLDVVDSIRSRYPELFVQPAPRPKPNLPLSHDPYHTERLQTFTTVSSYAQPHQLRSEDNGYEVMTNQTYQNAPNIVDTAITAALDANGQSFAYQDDPKIYANNQPNSGIYDNDCIINAQMSQSSNEPAAAASTTNGSNATEGDVYATVERSSHTKPDMPIKPPVAAKPTNLHNKFKVALNTSPIITNIPITVEHSSLIDEPLKIVESEQDLYSNSGAVVE